MKCLCNYIFYPKYPQLINCKRSRKLVSGFRINGNAIMGGQKLVYPGVYNHENIVLKIIEPKIIKAADETAKVQFDNAVSRIEREVKILDECASRHIVKLGSIPLSRVKFGKDRHLIAFSEEQIDGSSLFDIIATGPIDSLSIIDLGIQMCGAIGSLWDKKFLHRDVKPSNIMRRNNNGDFVLLDMGYAFDYSQSSLSGGLVFGTVDYVAPERLDLSKPHKTFDFRSDYFSLGIILYEAMTGIHPFRRQGAAQDEIIANIVTTIPKYPHEIQASITPRLSEITLKLLEKKPHLRFRNSRLLTEALASCR